MQRRQLSGEALGPGQFGLSAGIDPTCRGPASLEAVSKSSESAAQGALQGLTCEKKTESILVNGHTDPSWNASASVPTPNTYRRTIGGLGTGFLTDS